METKVVGFGQLANFGFGIGLSRKGRFGSKTRFSKGKGEPFGIRAVLAVFGGPSTSARSPCSESDEWIRLHHCTTTAHENIQIV